VRDWAANFSLRAALGWAACRRVVRVRLLLCDDHGRVREGLRAMLESHGFEIVAEVADAREAIERHASSCRTSS
jgi:CheY-like chemotaxis protein